jgi:hypothetical protein
MRTNWARPLLPGVLGLLVATTMLVVVPASVALAGPQVTISGNPANNTTATVSGSGFPPIAKDPTGVQIIECSDPKGKIANLPTSAANCDGATQNPLPVNQNAQGSFTTSYAFQKLTAVHGTSNIPCDTMHYCVLWVGVDYNNDFLGGPHAFSSPFEVGRPVATSSINAAVVWIPIVVIAGVGAAIAVVWRRRRSSSTVSSSEQAIRSRVSA